MKRYIIFAFDMETDIGSYLKSYNGVQRGTPRIVSLLERYNIPATFLFTGHAAEHNQDVVKQLDGQGFEIGCHSLRHETVGEASFNMPGDSPILESEIENRLALNKAIIRRLIPKDPVSFRAPRLWQGQTQIRALEKQGFLVDASYSVASHRKHILPYHPSQDNWLEEGNLRLLEIPNFAFLDDKNDYSSFFCKNDQWPLLRLLGAEFVFKNAQYVLESQKSQADAGVLLFYLHPWEFEEMPGKYEYDEGTFFFRPELYKNCGFFALNELEKYIIMTLHDGFEFLSCKDFYTVWEGKEYGRR